MLRKESVIDLFVFAVVFSFQYFNSQEKLKMSRIIR
jgi:hypothetical protein